MQGGYCEAPTEPTPCVTVLRVGAAKKRVVILGVYVILDICSGKETGCNPRCIVKHAKKWIVAGQTQSVQPAK